MNILLYTKSKFIGDELKKVLRENDKVIFLSSFEEIKNNLSTQDFYILLHHLDDFKNSEEIAALLKDYPNIFAVGLSNNPNNIEGCKLLQVGYKSYLHSFSNSDIFMSAIKSVSEGNIYVYPKLMQFLISNVAPKENLTNLDILTPKELAVLELIGGGKSNKTIAMELDIAEVTVKKHISSLFEKLEVKDRLSLALKWHSTFLQ